MTLILSRRGFLTGLAALVAAPAIVRADSLMPISAAKLWTPPTSIIGSIKPIMGAVPEGWIPCDGRWLIARDYPALHALLGSKHGPDGGLVGNFFLPDMGLQAQFDRHNGKDVGRYVIYAGDDQIRHKAELSSLMSRFKCRSGGIPDKFITLDWSKLS